MSTEEPDDRGRDERHPSCPTCGAPNRAGDRFCARCGAPLAPQPTAPRPGAAPTSSAADTSPPESARPDGDEADRDDERAAWIFGARPATVIAGGLLLLLLAAALLAIGQRDSTGTIVMLSICTAPLGLLTLAIGIARSIAGAARRG